MLLEATRVARFTWNRTQISKYFNITLQHSHLHQLHGKSKACTIQDVECWQYHLLQNATLLTQVRSNRCQRTMIRRLMP